MIIAVRTIIQEISNALNKSEFKIGDIVYEYHVSKYLHDYESESKIEIIYIHDTHITGKFLGHIIVSNGKKHNTNMNYSTKDRFEESCLMSRISKTPKLYR
jgi:hypothetical protein